MGTHKMDKYKLMKEIGGYAQQHFQGGSGGHGGHGGGPQGGHGEVNSLFKTWDSKCLDMVEVMDIKEVIMEVTMEVSSLFKTWESKCLDMVEVMDIKGVIMDMGDRDMDK